MSLLAFALSACGGGGGGAVKQTPPPASAYDPGFVPTVSIDNGLGNVNPPTVPTQAAPATFANPSLAQQLIVTDAAGALGAGLTGQGVTIGLLDTGVDRSHPALSGRVLQDFVNVSASGNNTSVDDVVRHGTTVAMLAAGKSISANYIDENENIVGTGTWGGGVAPSANIVSSRIISDNPPEDDGSGQGNEIGAGQGYGDYFRQLNAQLADAGAKIINNSWGGLYWNDPALTNELGAAWRDFVINRGGIIVFATGNESATDPSDNAALPSMIGSNGAKPAADLERGWLAVTAVDPDNPGQLDRYTDDQGNTVVYPNACGVAMNYCLAAPGTVVYPDYTQDSKKILALWQGAGTSFAAPQVSGAAAVVWSAFPYFTNDLVRQTLLGAAKDIGDPGVDPVFGWGLLDVSKAANGPSNFAWGDVSVSFTGNSVWRNPIVGNGGLIKSGNGTLTLAETASYTGATQVQAGGLDVRKGMASSVSVSNGATVWASGSFGGDVGNGGKFFVGAGNPASIAGDFTQSSTGNLGVWLGSALHVGGSATLAGQVSILGVKGGYTTASKETLLNAAGGVSGTFASVKAASNVFLDASLSYDPNDVFLNISRIDVTHAVAAMGLSGGITVASAQRVEAAFDGIDAQLSGGAGGIGAAFIDGAGKLQQIASAAQAERSIRSLSGALHAAADAVGFDSIEANRRALSSRFGELAAQAALHGDWSKPLEQPGQGGPAIGPFQRNGWTMGSDARIGTAGVVGFAFGETDADGFLDGGRDHDRQTQAQFYFGGMRGNAYAMGQVGAGRFQRQLRRELLLGDEYAGVATDYAGRFFAAGVETGYRFGAFEPYAGVDYVRFDRDGFVESGADGFGLKTNPGIAQRTQAIAGLRARREWGRFGVHGFAEWQRALSEDGLLADASFVGADAWSPLYGEGFSRGSGLFGVGADAALTRNAALSFGYDRRFGSAFDGRQWSAKLTYGF